MRWPWEKYEPETLHPGDCECGHSRCSHVKGKGRCEGEWPPDEELNEWTACSCQLYIRDDDDDSDDSPEPVSPEVKELERMTKL